MCRPSALQPDRLCRRPPFEVFGDQPALLLGTDLMKNLRRVSLDFREPKMRFQLNRCSRQAVGTRTGMSARTLISGNRDTACALELVGLNSIREYQDVR